MRAAARVGRGFWHGACSTHIGMTVAPGAPMVSDHANLPPSGGVLLYETVSGWPIVPTLTCNNRSVLGPIFFRVIQSLTVNIGEVSK